MVTRIGDYTVRVQQPLRVERRSGWRRFWRTLGSVGLGVAGAALPTSLLGGALRAIGVDNGVGSQMQLLEMQRQIQWESQLVSLMTNIAKARHDASMAVIRNLR